MKKDPKRRICVERCETQQLPSFFIDYLPGRRVFRIEHLVGHVF
jgi:hypothetical protein